MLKKILNIKLFIGISLIISVICSAIPSPIANATSTYDDALNLTPRLLLESYQSTPTVQDLTLNWAEKITVGPYCSQSEVNSFNNKSNWSVTSSTFSSSNPKSINLTWTESNDTQPTAGFMTINEGTSYEAKLLRLSSLPTHGAVIQIDDQGNLTTSCGSIDQTISKKIPGFLSLQVKLFFSTYAFDEPDGYVGPAVPTSSAWADLDGDGLIASQEAETSQGTSNYNKDTDGDGVSDFIESVYNPNRADTFCGSTCAYPTPNEKDLYVEVDWMKDPLTNESYKPTTTQLTSVINAYSAHSIHAHFDTGQYGGGNELPTYVSELKFAPDSGDSDFFDIKNGDGVSDPNFSSSRRGVWHYMVTGYKAYVDGANISTGASYAGDDDALIAIGRVKELASTGQDTAIAGTIMHELGHNLCLSDTTYTGQDSSCLFSGVDTHAGNNYLSSMNYDKQLNLVDYSEGNNGVSDHNDWSAALIGMKDFVTHGEDPTENFARGSIPFSKQVEN